MPETEGGEFITLDGLPMSEANQRQAVAASFNCLRCARSISIKDAKAGIAYFDFSTNYRVAACKRCLERRKNETISLVIKDVWQSIQSDYIRRQIIREVARWN